jgi:hypothetical protein
MRNIGIESASCTNKDIKKLKFQELTLRVGFGMKDTDVSSESAKGGGA